jgi:hypothetical protein
LILLCGVEKASIMIVFFFDRRFRLWLPNGVFSRTITAKQLLDLCRLICEINLGIRLQSIYGVKSVISIAITSGEFNAQTTCVIPCAAYPDGTEGTLSPLAWRGPSRREVPPERSVGGSTPREAYSEGTKGA